MLPGQILPPPPPENDDPTLDLSRLAAMAATGAPASQRETDIHEVAGLPSWTPQTSSAFPPAWSAPPRSRGQRTTFAALGGGALAAIALCAALVTWSRMPDVGRHAGTAAVQVALAAEVAPVAAELAPIAEVVPLAAEVAPVAAEVAPVAAEVAPVVAEVAAVATDVAQVTAVAPPRAVQVASLAEDEVVQVAAPVAATEPVQLVEQPPRATELESPAIAAAVEAPPLDADLALLALAAEPVEPAQAQPAEQATTEPEMPAVPTRESAVAAMDGVRSAVQACAGQRHGRVPVLLTVASDGRVRSAVVSGAFAGTPEGSCIARAVRAARFPAFAQERFEITYPFAL